MENANVKTNEIEEITEVEEVEETSESNSGSLLAGIVGGFLAYGIIAGAKKLKAVIDKKRAQKKEAEFIEADGEVVYEDDVEKSDS